LMALGIGPGDDVIVPDFTFFAPAGCVARLGANPVFADIDTYYGIDPDLLADLIGPRTKAVIVVHLFGQVAAIEAIAKICASHGIPIIEDCAQAVGVSIDSRHIGHHGSMACFSFFPTKNLGASGDAGAVVTNDENLAKRLRRLRVHGAQPKYVHQELGGNFRLDALQAAILTVKLPYVNAWNARRRSHAAIYDAVVDRPAKVRPGVASTFHQYVIEAESRDELRKHLATNGIETAVYYPGSMGDQPCFSTPSKISKARTVAQRVLALPVFPQLLATEVKWVAAQVRDFTR
jgi:dTDP-4-amino-4,6-dideoxygalactose transaminase